MGKIEAQGSSVRFRNTNDTKIFIFLMTKTQVGHWPQNKRAQEAYLKLRDNASCTLIKICFYVLYMVYIFYFCKFMAMPQMG